MGPDRTASARRPLDALNFFLADVRDGLGPYLAIYLLTVQHWDEASIGFTLSAAGIAGIVAQTPAGALIDTVRAKRAIIVAAAIAITIASLAIPVFPSLVPVTILQAVSGIAGAIFPQPSPRSRSASSDRRRSRPGSAAMRPSTMPATLSPRCSRAASPTGSAPSRSSG